jgi:hypothetical protein
MDIGVIELRQYQLVPGRRDELIDIFDSYLVEPQEECGMRGFQDMTSRNSALADFYLGPRAGVQGSLCSPAAVSTYPGSAAAGSA